MARVPLLPSHMSQGLEPSLVRKFLILSFYLILQLLSLPFPSGLSAGSHTGPRASMVTAALIHHTSATLPFPSSKGERPAPCGGELSAI